MKKCPFCAEEIQDEAIVCRYCGRDLKPAQSDPPPEHVAAPQPGQPPVSASKPNKLPLPVVVIISLIVVILALLLFSSANHPSSTAPAAPAAPAVPAASEKYKITYRISGATSHASLTYQNENGDTEQTDANVPWEKSFYAQPGDFLYIAAQNSQDSGGVKCEILVNGVVVKQSESTGAYVIADCSGRL